MNQITNDILNVFDNYRMAPTAIDQYEQIGKAILAEKVQRYIDQNNPIQFAMLGMPFKSTNTRDKVLGEMPDLGEELMVKNFETFNDEIKRIYNPGSNITVASDGYVFNDLLSVSDSTVERYAEKTNSFKSNSTMSVIDLNEFYSTGTLQSKREKLMQQFGYDWVKMEHEILFNPDVNFLYKSMMKFMEEEIANREFVSKNQMHKAAKILTREMMLRNEAYNSLIRHELPNHIRLSMHPSVNNGYKYGFKLIPGNQIKHSPWHCSIVMDGTEAITMHRKDAEAAGYELIYKDQQPYNFIKS